ncbi:MAG TPA: 7TM-DISM domain-containing protein, partial [Ramlibacter sp.]|nr:7TM-DISM domain-containing protein [Ramlibacter sp.]
MRRWIRWLCLLLALLAGPAGAADVALGAASSYPLSRSFDVLEDPAGNLAFADLQRPDVQGRFRPLPVSGPGPNFGLSRSAYWLRVTLRPSREGAGDWLLEVAYPPLDQVDVHLAGPGGVQHHAGGDRFEFASRAIAHRNHVFPLRLQAAGEHTLYLRVRSDDTVSAPARLWRPAALWSSDQAGYGVLSLYFGLVVGLLLYNLLLFVSVRDPAYLVYVAFAAAMGLGQAALNGLGAQYLWPHAAWWNSVSVPVGLTTTALF